MGTSGTLRFHKNFLITLLEFELFWDSKHTNAIHVEAPGTNNSDKILYSSTMDKIHLERNGFDGSVVSGVREPILFSFFHKSGYKKLCEPLTIHYKKINK